MSQKIKVDQIADLSATAAQLNFTVGVTASIQTQIDAKLPKTGGALTGAVTTNSTFDGRDVSADGAKLDGIEAGATTDQTASEIRALVESATDSNVFTDADHTKLNGIEAGANVTDATNVAAAGALMDSEVTNLAQVKAFDSSDYATAAQGTTADTALQSGDNVSALTNNAGYLTSVPAQSFSSLTGKPTTVSGYGITDAFNGAFSSLSGKPTTIAGYGITDAFDGAYGSLTGTPTIPTNNNQLTNGAGYITSVPAQSFSSLTGKPTTIAGYGITDAFDGAYGSLTGTPTIPTNNSQLTNGAGYITSVPAQSFSSLTGKPTTISGYGITDAFDGAYGSLTGTPTIPTNNNQLTNGAGYITSVPAQSFASLTGKPTTISGYGITDVVGQFTAGTGITIAGNGTIATTVTATTSASDLTSGTLPDARFPSVLPAISGANLTNLPASGIANVVDDTTPQLGGDLQSNGHDIDFANNDKAVFGANADLEVYSDGTSSFVHSKKAGAYLRLKSEGGIVLQAGNSENVLFAAQNGKTALYFDAAEKLETTSYGIDISGSVVADTHTASLTGSQTADFNTYQNFVWTLTGNITLANPTTEKTGQSGFFIFIHSGAARTVSLGTDYETAGGAGLTLSSASGAVDIVPYVVQSAGNILLGTPQLAFS